MSTQRSLTRRQALLYSTAGVAGLALGGLPRFDANAAAAARPLPIPTLIEARNGEPVTLALQKSSHRFGLGAAVPSTGISSSYLGPVVRVRSGDTIPFRVENRLDEETTLHWHGLLIPSDVDGGPHNTIKPGGVWTPELKINQPAATHWFHPHPHGNTAKQVYGGLAGMMIVSDGGDRDRGLPETYGVDDLPIVLQDKRFGRNGALVYEPTMMDLMHGFQGETLIVNGAIAPVANVPAGFVRLRLLNAANARNFDLRFSDRRPFYVVGSDAGLLPEPVEVRNLVIAPAERYEVLVNFSDGRAVELVTGPDTHHGMGPGDDDADGASKRRRRDRDLHAISSRPGVEGRDHTVAQGADEACFAESESSGCAANARARSHDGNGDGQRHGNGHDGHARSAKRRRNARRQRRSRPCRRGPDDGDQWPAVRHAQDRHHDQARNVGDLGHPIGCHGAPVPHARRELPHPEQQRQAAKPRSSRLEGRRAGGRSRGSPRPIRSSGAGKDAIHVPLPHPRT